MASRTNYRHTGRILLRVILPELDRRFWHMGLILLRVILPAAAYSFRSHRSF